MVRPVALHPMRVDVLGVEAIECCAEWTPCYGCSRRSKTHKTFMLIQAICPKLNLLRVSERHAASAAQPTVGIAGMAQH